MSILLKSKIQKLPQSPGVYVFRGSKGVILYIGKATNLRSRVGSYFSGKSSYARPIEIFIDKVADIGYQKTDSVLEALILESALIKKYEPKYNAIGKDDKSFAYFVITKEEWPRVLIVRATDLFHPHPSRQDHRGTFSLKREKKIGIVKKFGPYASKKQMQVALKIIRKIFPFHSLNKKTEKGDLDFQLGLCPGPYAGAITKEYYMKNIRGIRMILKGKKKLLVKKLEKEMKEYAARHKFEKAADIRNKMFSLKHIQDVALLNRDENFQFSTLLPHLPRFGEASWQAGNFQINSKLFRIEAYDISNISGQYATGSMVVFQNDKPDKSQYRKFRIKTITSSNDVGMMREVLSRRFKNDWPRPDLILLDGGIGHLSMGERLLQELKLEIPLAAVAKGPSRRIFNSQFLISKQFSKQFPISKSLNLKSIIKNKNLIGKIMGEAHRFAIGYHRKLRRKAHFPVQGIA